MLLLWGNNSDSQLGDCDWCDDTDDENESNSKPTEILEPTPCKTFANRKVTDVSCGSRHTLAITEDGAAWSWGWGARGQLGHGNRNGCSKPKKIEVLYDKECCNFPSQISAGGTHSGCILNDGSVFMWGDCTYGQLGLGEGAGGRDASVNTPERVHLMTNEPLYATKLCLGGMHTAAITVDHRIVCFGRADSGQLGIGSDWIIDSSYSVMGKFCPQVVGGALEGVKITHVSCGAFHTACCSDDGRVFTWGKEDYGALGCDNDGLLRGGLMVPHHINIGGIDMYPSPDCSIVSIRSNGARVIECGGWHTVTIDENGLLWACGRGEFGRLGVDDVQSRRELVQLPDWKPSIKFESSTSTLMPVNSISLGGSHSLALLKDGSVYSWGRASRGRLGVKTDANCIMKPICVMNAASGKLNFKVIAISAGGSHNAAIVVNNTNFDVHGSS